MTRVLLVDDDPFLLRSLEKLLASAGYTCRSASSAAEAGRALDAESAGRIGLVILDVGLPDRDGFSFCRQIRARCHVPILLLTARSDTTDKVCGLEVGADDYMTKPFEPREFVARVRALLRRAGEYSAAPAVSQQVEMGRLALDLEGRTVLREGRAVHLTRREYDLLELLAHHRGKALASDWIFERVWGDDLLLGPKALTVCVQRLRQKIEEEPRRPRLLLTVRGFGYKLAAE